MKYKVKWTEPDIDSDEIIAAIDSIKKDVGANGKIVKKFEKEFAKKVGSKHAIATSNGTSALFTTLMYYKEKLGKNIKIGVPSFTFIASVNVVSVLFGNKNIVLLDCDEKTWNINKNNIPMLENGKPAIDLLISVDVGGLSCDYDSLKELGIPIIADSAESLGSTYKGELVGTQCDVHCFSLHKTKIVTGGEGGMITTNNFETYKMCKSIVNHGYALLKNSYEYKHDQLGLNFRMGNVNAAMAREQLKKLDLYVSHRNKIADIYKEKFIESDVKEISFQEFDSYIYKDNYFFFGVKLNNRNIDNIIRNLKYEYSVETKKWTAVHKQPLWKGRNIKLPVAGDLSDNMILLPIYNTMPLTNVYYVINALLKTIERGLNY